MTEWAQSGTHAGLTLRLFARPIGRESKTARPIFRARKMKFFQA